MKKGKILIIDDDQGILEVIKIILEDKDFEVETLLNGQNIDEKIQERLPDVALIDLWMAGVDGYKLIKKLRTDTKTNKLPIIAISALNEGDVLAKKAGADDFLAKPFDINDLVAIVEKHLPPNSANT